MPLHPPLFAKDGDILQPLTTIGTDPNTPVEWVACEPGGIDRHLLLDQSSPILMYDDVVLFEDFIHDHGVVRMSVKTRIMPRCWFVLLRYWLRVDGVVMKVCVSMCAIAGLFFVGLIVMSFMKCDRFLTLLLGPNTRR